MSVNPVQLMVGMGGMAAFISLLSLLTNVFLGLAIYNDAKSWGCDNAVMWAVLSGVFGLIPAIIYLVIRSDSSSKMKCPVCGNKIAKGSQFCPVCSNPVPPVAIDYAAAAESKKRAKLFLILMIVAFVLSIVVAVVGMSSIIAGSMMYNY